MSERIDLLDLSADERRAAAKVVAAASKHTTWDRVEAVFRSLARAEWLYMPVARPLALALPYGHGSLLRHERALATSIVLTLHMYFDGDEEKTERVIEFLAQRGAALDALFIHEAAVTSMAARAINAIKEGRAIT